MIQLKNSPFDSVLYALPEKIASVLENLPLFIKSSAYEIRLRLDRPLLLTCDCNMYVSFDAVASTNLPKNPLIITKDDLLEIIVRITNRSVYTREAELKQGYLSMAGGHRAGVCGSFSGGFFGEVTSVNIRIARQVLGSADSLVCEAGRGLLIAGPPGSGKTTLLRDLVRQLSNGGNRICVVDTRGEICGKRNEGAGLDIGINTDVITGLDKAQGVENALRSMFPQYIAFDEIGTGEELSLVRESFFSGVKILTTAHISDETELKRRAVTSMLLEGGIEKIAILSGKIGQEPRIIGAEEARRLA